MNKVDILLGFIAGSLFGLLLGVNLYHYVPEKIATLVIPLPFVAGDPQAVTTLPKLHNGKVPPPVSEAANAYFCPTAREVANNLHKIGNWAYQHLSWSFDHRTHEPSSALRFERALYKEKTNEMTCYYVWPDPDDEKTKLWLTISVNLDYNQVIKPLGAHWNKDNGINQLLAPEARTYKSCNATSVRTCAFTIGLSSENK